jgi:hypothetical protein
MTIHRVRRKRGEDTGVVGEVSDRAAVHDPRLRRGLRESIRVP